MLDIKKMLTKVIDLVGGDKSWTNLNGNVWYKKRCDIVYLRCVNGNNVQLTKAGTTLGTLPTGYRPDYQYDMAGTALGGAESVFFRVETSGKIIGFASATTSYWSGTICFPMRVGGGYCLNGLKAVFSRLSAIAERRWHHVKHQENTHQTAADVRRNEDNIHADKGNCLRNLWRLLLRAVWAVRPLTSWLKRSDRKLGECGVQSAGWNQTNEQSVLGRNKWRHHGSGLCGSYRRRQSERSSVKNLLRSRCVLASVAPSEGGCF